MIDDGDAIHRAIEIRPSECIAPHAEDGGICPHTGQFPVKKRVLEFGVGDEMIVDAFDLVVPWRPGRIRKDLFIPTTFQFLGKRGLS